MKNKLSVITIVAACLLSATFPAVCASMENDAEGYFEGMLSYSPARGDFFFTDCANGITSVLYSGDMTGELLASYRGVSPSGEEPVFARFRGTVAPDEEDSSQTVVIELDSIIDLGHGNCRTEMLAGIYHAAADHLYIRLAPRYRYFRFRFTDDGQEFSEEGTWMLSSPDTVMLIPDNSEKPVGYCSLSDHDSDIALTDRNGTLLTKVYIN